MGTITTTNEACPRCGLKAATVTTAYNLRMPDKNGNLDGGEYADFLTCEACGYEKGETGEVTFPTFAVYTDPFGELTLDYTMPANQRDAELWLMETEVLAHVHHAVLIMPYDPDFDEVNLRLVWLRGGPELFAEDPADELTEDDFRQIAEMYKQYQ